MEHIPLYYEVAEEKLFSKNIYTNFIWQDASILNQNKHFVTKQTSMTEFFSRK